METENVGIYFMFIITTILIIVAIAMWIRENRKRAELTQRITTEVMAEPGFEKAINELLLSAFGSDEWERIYPCSRNIASNFQYNEYRMNYLSKYFDFVVNDETLDIIDRTINTMKTAKEAFIEKVQKAGLYNCALPVPKYYCCYRSPQGKSSLITEFRMNIENLEWLKASIEKINSKKSSKRFQRTLMTPELREAIIRRDNWTCQKCGNSVFKEPNLLLEVDHIIPVSKGGKTEPNNLQTLCWKCNREKSDKIDDE